ERMHVSRQRSIAAGRVRIKPAARLDRQVCRLLHGLDGKILHRVYHNGPLPADPRDDRRPVFIIVAAAGLALLASTPRAVSQRLLPTLFGLTLMAGGVVGFVGFDSHL